MLCLNSRERFEDNKRFLRSRIEKSVPGSIPQRGAEPAGDESVPDITIRISTEERKTAERRMQKCVRCFFALVNRAGRCGQQTVTAIGDAMGIEWAGLGLVPQKGSALFCCKGRLPQPADSIDVGR